MKKENTKRVGDNIPKKAKDNPKSLRCAINNYCWECSGEQYAEIKYCTALNCPLWNFRPYK